MPGFIIILAWDTRLTSVVRDAFVYYCTVHFSLLSSSLADSGFSCLHACISYIVYLFHAKAEWLTFLRHVLSMLRTTIQLEMSLTLHVIVTRHRSRLPSTLPHPPMMYLNRDCFAALSHPLFHLEQIFEPRSCRTNQNSYLSPFEASIWHHS